MSEYLKRRDFIKTASLLGASFAMADAVSSNSFLQGNNSDEIRNNYFVISFDKKRGTFHVSRNNGTSFITSGSSNINTNTGKRSTADGKYTFNIRSSVFNDQLGSGVKMIVPSKDIQKKLDIEIQFSLYDQMEVLTIEATCKNISRENIIIDSIKPVRVTNNQGGALHVPGVSKCLTNGEMYFDTGMICIWNECSGNRTCENQGRKTCQ